MTKRLFSSLKYVAVLYFMVGLNAAAFSQAPLPTYNYILVDMPWKLTQMYIDSVPVAEDKFSNIEYGFTSDGYLMIFRKGSDDAWFMAKYGVTFAQNKFHVFNPSDNLTIFDADIISLTSSSLVFVCNQKDVLNPSQTHLVEYRFIADLNFFPETPGQ